MSRRRKQPSPSRPRGHKHHASCSCGPVAHCPDSWPNATVIAEHVDLDALTRRVLDELTNDDVHELMQQIPHKFRQLMLREIGLSNASNVNRGMAGMVLARMRSEQNPAASLLLNMLTQPVTLMLEKSLEAEEWASLLGEDDRAAVRVLADHESVSSLLTTTVEEMSPLLRTVGLVSAVAHNAAASAVALALLAKNDEACSRAHAELTRRYPQMPMIPTGDLIDLLAWSRLRAALPDEVRQQIGVNDENLDSLRSLIDEFLFEIANDDGLGNERHVRGDKSNSDAPVRQVTVADVSSGKVSAEIDAPSNYGQEDEDDVAPEAIISEITEVLDSWPEMADYAETAFNALRSGQLPRGPHLESLVDFHRAVVSAVSNSSYELDRVVEPALDDLRLASGEITARIQHSQNREWLVALAGLEAPAVVAAAAEAARTLAARALRPDAPADQTADEVDVDALRALHTIITLARGRMSGQEINYGALTDADALVRDRLPSVVPLLLHAGYGAVTVPMHTQAVESAASSAQPADLLTPAAKAPFASTSRAGEGTMPAPIEIPTGDPQDQPAAAPLGLVAEPPVVGGSVTPASIEQQSDSATAAQAASNPDQNVLESEDENQNEGEDDEDADLAAMLAGEGARTLSALTSAPRSGAEPTARAVEPGHGTAFDPSTPVSTPSRTGERRPRLAGPGQTGPEGLLDAPSFDAIRDSAADIAQAHDVQAALLSTGRFALAADLLEAAGAPEATVAARRGVAYATALRHPTGQLASAFSRVSTTLTRDELSDDRAGQLLAWAAAARLTLLSPSAGPAGILANLAPVIASSDALNEVGNALIEASRSGLVVLPENAHAVGDLAAQEVVALEIAREASEMLSSAGTRAIKYVPANAVYQTWMNVSGELGQLLVQVAKADPDLIADVRDRVVKLRGNAEKAIDETREAVRKKHHKESKIIAGARQTLTARWDEVVDVASRWADAAERAELAQARLNADAWQAAPLPKLRSRLAAVRTQAIVDLTSLHATPESSNHNGDVLSELDAARAVAGALLESTFAISDGQADQGDEPPAAYVAHFELLATDLPLQPRSLLPDDGLSSACLPDLLDLAAEVAADAQQVYDHRSGRGDHDLTVTLIAGLRASDPHAAQTLERHRTSDVADHAISVADQLSGLTRDMDAQRMSGGLDDGPYSSLSSRAQALGNATRNDFGRIRAEADAIRAGLAENLQIKIDQALARINTRAASNQQIAAIADALTDLTRSGQIASAEEYLEQGHLPAASTDTDHLRQFFPAVPDLYAATPELPGQLHQALVGDTLNAAAATLMQHAGIELEALSEARRVAGTRALSSFAALSGRGAKLDAVGALRNVLSQAGFEFLDAQIAPAGRGAASRQWVTLTGVTGTGKALVPLLGSAMSPDGSTLRLLVVYNAPSPATVLEWTLSEPPDQTVLALWTGQALTAIDRRTIADAARGRPTPPVLFLDAAVLGYLVCQREPRRSTFATTALPLAAVSPFRDTPGDTPPEMFYGRTEEMAAVLDLRGPSVLYGGRQLGKSALLRTAADRFEASGEGRVAVLHTIFTVGSEETDRDPSRLWEVLWARLAARGIVPVHVPPGVEVAQAVYDNILAWLNDDAARNLLVLLDEADVFLDADAAGNRFTHVDWCRRIMVDSSRRAKFVFAGLHRTARFESLPNQPLSHLGRPVSVGPLRPQHALDLLTRPLAAMGLRFAEPVAGPARVLALANNMPALLQLFGRALMAQVTSRPVDAVGPPSLIGNDDIDAVFNDADLREAFRDKYQLTIRLDHRYMVITYVVAEAAHDRGIDTSLSLTELLTSCRQAWPAGFADMATDEFRGLVTECVDLSVLAEDDGRFRIRTPTVLRLLGTEEHVLDVLYTRTNDMSAPSPTDAASYRRKLGDGSARSPFTERQLGQLFTPTSRVLIITGSGALGAQRAISALEEAGPEARGRVDCIRRGHTVTPDGIRSEVGKLVGKRCLLLLDATRTSAQMLRVLLAEAEAALGSHSDRQVTIAMVAGPANASGWVDWPHRLQLGRVDNPGLRLWAEEANLPFQDEEAVTALRAATGGWPMLVSRVDSMRTGERPVEIGQHLLEDLRNYLAGSGASELLHQTELESGALASAFASITRLTATKGEDLDFLAELLPEDGVDTAAVAAAGYADLTDVIIALRALGCLVSDSEGRLQPEPVLAAAHLVAISNAGAGSGGA